MIPLRAMLLLSVGLACGAGARLALRTEPPAEFTAAKSAPGPVAGSLAGAAAGKSSPRPEEEAILKAAGASRYRALMSWLPGATAEDLRSMADALPPVDASETLSIRLLMARWAEVEPAAMLAWVEGQTGEAGRKDFLLNNAIEAWARVDFDAAWRAARSGQRISALLGLTLTDAGRALSLLRNEPSLLEPDPFDPQRALLQRLTAKVPAGAVELLQSLPADQRKRHGGTIALAWAKRDPAAAAQWLRGLSPAERAAGMEEACKWIAAHAPESLAAALEGMPAGRLRAVAEGAAFSRLAAGDPAAARRQLETMPPGLPREYSRGLLMVELNRLGDTEGAIALARQLGWSFKKEWNPGARIVTTENSESVHTEGSFEVNTMGRTMESLFEKVVKSDPARAAVLLEEAGSDGIIESLHADTIGPVIAALSQREGDTTLARCGELAGRWAREKPDAAAAWAAAQPEGKREALLSPVFEAWSEDPEALLGWAQSRDADVQQRAWQQITENNEAYAYIHAPDIAAALGPQGLADLLQSEDLRGRVAGSLLQELPEDSPAALTTPVKAWLGEEPEKASEWVRALPEGPRRNGAALAVIEHLRAEGDAEGAFAWGATLPEESRAEALSDAVKSWRTTAPDAAAAAIHSSSLPPPEKQALLELLKP